MMTVDDRLAALEAQVRTLADRQEILDCIQRNARGNDRFDVDLVSSSYHADASHENGLRQVAGHDYGAHARLAHDRICERSLHNVTTHRCDIDGDVAHAESYSLGLFLDKGGETSRMLAGRYIDRLERRDGEWRLVLRRATVEIVLEGAARFVNGKGLIGSGYLKGSRDDADPSYERPLRSGSGEHW